MGNDRYRYTDEDSVAEQLIETATAAQLKYMCATMYLAAASRLLSFENKGMMLDLLHQGRAQGKAEDEAKRRTPVQPFVHPKG